MKKIVIVGVRLAFIADDENEDVVSSLLTENCQAFSPESTLLDWHYTGEQNIEEVPDEFGFDSLSSSGL